jgi:hypothetical protein
MQSINQGLVVTLAKVQGFSKDALKISLRFILKLNKQNGISSDEMFTTEESLEHCKKAVGNISLNITVGIAKCKKAPLKYLMPKDLTLQDVVIDAFSVLTSKNKYIEGALGFLCIGYETLFSVIDEDFSQCLVGLENMINE